MDSFMQGCFAPFAASSRQTMQSLDVSLHEDQSDHGFNEKLRLFYTVHTSAEQQKFIEALNHWEEVVEIVSYIPSTASSVFNGVIYIQRAAAYF